MKKQPRIYPPVYFLIFFIAGILLDRYLHIVRLGSVPWLGILLALPGIASGIWAGTLFRKKKTAIKPFEKSSALIEEGPYAITRNPMYVGFTFVLLGEAIYLGSLSAFFAPLAMYYILDTQFIPFEEKMLEETFQEKYKQYQKRVCRWL